jgi:hypothetical protein
MQPTELLSKKPYDKTNTMSQSQHPMAPMLRWSTHYLAPSFAPLMLALRTLIEHQMVFLVVEIPEHPRTAEYPADALSLPM